MKLRKKVEIEIKKGWKNGVTELKKKELLCWYEQWSSIKNLTFFSIKGNAFSIKHNTNIYIYLVGYKSSVDKIVNPCNAMHLDRFFYFYFFFNVVWSVWNIFAHCKSTLFFTIWFEINFPWFFRWGMFDW
jgi:hypothetical protein